MKKIMTLFVAVFWASFCSANPLIIPNQLPATPIVGFDIHQLMKKVISEGLADADHQEAEALCMHILENKDQVSRQTLEHTNILFASSMYFIHGDTEKYYNITKDFRYKLMDKYNMPVTLYSVKEISEREKLDLAYVSYLINLYSVFEKEQMIEIAQPYLQALNLTNPMDTRMLYSSFDMMIQIALSELYIYLDGKNDLLSEEQKQVAQSLSKQYYEKEISIHELADQVNTMLLGQFAVNR